MCVVRACGVRVWRVCVACVRVCSCVYLSTDIAKCMHECACVQVRVCMHVYVRACICVSEMSLVSSIF